MSVTCPVSLLRNPATGKLESGYYGAGRTLTIPNNGSAEPSVAIFDNWMTKAVGSRSQKGNWDSGLYGATAEAQYPLYYSIDGVTGIGSRNINPLLTYAITVASSTAYRITIVGSTQFAMTSSGSATAAEIVSNLVSQINADSGCKATASGTTTLILARKDPAIPFAVLGAVDYPSAGYDTAADASGSGVNMISDNYLTGFIKLLPTNPKDIFMAWQMGVPTGYFFSGATEVNTTNPSSNMKSMWASDQGLDSPKLADFIGASRPDTGQWSARGNQSNVSLNEGNQLDFGKLLSFMVMHKAGTNAFTDNGVCRAVSAGLAGTVSSAQTDRPLFIRNTTLEVTKFDLTLYTVTINGTVCTYMSGASATKNQIIDGLVIDINSKISGSVGYSLSFQGELTFIPVQGGLPTITAGANIVKTDLSPSFSQVSTIWQGNKNQVNSVEVCPWAYISYGDACGNYVALGNSGTFSSVTDWKLVKHATWSSSESQHNPTPEQLTGKTHWYRFVDNVVISSGAL